MPCAAFRGRDAADAPVESQVRQWLDSSLEHPGVTIPQVVFRFALDVGMLPLTGTTDPDHMAQDLAVTEFELESADLARIERVAIA